MHVRISDTLMPRRLCVGVAALLCLVAANAWALSGATTAASDTVAKNGKVVTDCSSGAAQLTGSLICGNGRSGGQVIYGGTGTSETLTFVSTSGTVSTAAGIIFGDSCGFDETNNRLGIGTLTPARGIDVVKGTTGQTLINGGNGEILSLAFGTNTSADALWLGQARGTRTSPTAIQSGDQMGGINFVGHDGSAFAGGARILGIASQTWTGSVHGTELRFSTTPNGSTTGAERLRIGASGNVGVGGTSLTSLLNVGSSDQFQVNSSGDVVKLKNLTYAWPSAHVTKGALTNDGSGGLAWGGALRATTVTATETALFLHGMGGL